MSLILDALRRAERARDKDLTRRVSEAGAPRLHVRRRAWVPAAMLVFVAALAAALLWPRPVSDPIPSAGMVIPADAVSLPAAPPHDGPAARGSSLADIAVPEPSVDLARQQALSPMLHELPAAQRASIPAVSVDAHFWSEDPARRFVVLDMRRVRAGEEAWPGLRVIAIDADSVELDWQGTRFRLPAR